MELGTGTTDANMDEWLEVSFDPPPIYLCSAESVTEAYIILIRSALQGTAFAKDKAKKNK